MDRLLAAITSMSVLGIFLILAFPLFICVALSFFCLLAGAGSGH